MPKLGRYETLEELGRGGTSVVYRARDTATEREVAVKVLSSHLLHDAGLRARFEREIKLAVRLEHPHVVPILDVGAEGEFPYIVMRLLGGGSLVDRLRAGPLSVAETVRVVTQVASALDEAHRLHIVHRDLKPSNILFDRAGVAYLADFGVAKPLDSDTLLTASAGVVGTPAYMSPEQLLGKKVTGLADQYALGLVAFQALTARMPFDGTTAQMIIQHLQEPLPSVRKFNADLSPAFERVLARATAKEPTSRFATASEFAAALAVAAAGSAPPQAVPAGQPNFATEPDFALFTPPPATAHSLGVTAAVLVAEPPALSPVPLAPQPVTPDPVMARLLASQPAPLAVPVSVPVSRPPTRAPRRKWIVVGLVGMTLALLGAAGWRWLAAAPPASATPASTTTVATQAAIGSITLDPDAQCLALVTLPPGSAAAEVRAAPDGVVIATQPDQAIVQQLREPAVTVAGTEWAKVRLLSGESGWMVQGLLRCLSATSVEQIAAPEVTLAGAATPQATTRGVTPTRAQVTASPAATQTPRPNATGATAPSATNRPPTNTVAPPTNTSVPATNTSVPPTSASPTATPGLVCTVLPIFCP